MPVVLQSINIFFIVLHNTATRVQDCMINIDWSAKGMSYLKIIFLILYSMYYMAYVCWCFKP